MKQRIITAILALIVFVPILLYGQWPFVVMAYLLATIGLFELLNMYFNKKKFFIPTIFVTFSLWYLLLPAQFQLEHIPKVNVVIILVILLLIYTVLSKNIFTFDDAGFIVLTLIYISIGFYFFIYARTIGLNYILFILLVIWSTDTGAYFTGSAFGRRKLWPKISPNKTIEGALGGLLFAVIVAIIFQLTYPFDLSIYLIIGISIIISVFGQTGDLVASAYKRHYDIKDSGQILPGHGGILDRFDSLLFVLPILYLIQFLINKDV